MTRSWQIWRRRWLGVTVLGTGTALAGNAVGGLTLWSAIGLSAVVAAAVATATALSTGGRRDVAAATSEGLSSVPPASFLVMRQNVRWATEDPGRGGGEGMRRLLVTLTSDRLLARQGIDLHADPEQARAVVGPDLWAALSAADLSAGLPREGLAAITAQLMRL